MQQNKLRLFIFLMVFAEFNNCLLVEEKFKFPLNTLSWEQLRHYIYLNYSIEIAFFSIVKSHVHILFHSTNIC